MVESITQVGRFHNLILLTSSQSEPTLDRCIITGGHGRSPKQCLGMIRKSLFVP